MPIDHPAIEAFYHKPTGSLTYLVHDRVSRRAAVIDPVQDFDLRSARLWDDALKPVVEAIQSRNLTLDWILETHVHADHMTGAQLLKSALGGQIAIGAGVKLVQKNFAALYNFGPDFKADGRAFDRLLEDGERLALGHMMIEVIHTPGHTPACCSYRLWNGDAGEDIFCGDTIFMPDSGTARCDFPGGDARSLYRSISKLLALPPHVRLYVGHDYMPQGRALRCCATVAEQKAENIHLKGDGGEEDYVALREARDKTLSLPELMLAALPINLRAGRLPPPEANGLSYLKIPLNQFSAPSQES